MTPFPSGWMQVSLSELVDSNRGISYGVVQPGQHVNNGVPILRVNNVKNGQILAQDIMRISPDIEAKYSRTRLKGGEVLITIVGTVGDTAIATSREIGWNVARAVAVIPPRQGISAKWIQICLSSKNVREKIFSRVNTTVQTTLNLKDIAELDFPLPPDKELLAIEKIICGLDDKIELNRRMNATLEAMARSLFKSWFVDFDPVRAKSEGRQPFGMNAATASLFPSHLVPSEIGDIPEGWKSGTLNDVSRAQGGFAFKGNDFGRYGHPVIKIKNIRDDKTVDVFDVDYIPPNISKNLRNFWLYDGDVIVAMTGATVGKFGLIVNHQEKPLLLNQRVAKITPWVGDAWYVFCALCETGAANAWMNIAAGSAQPNISSNQILSISHIVPSDSVLELFNNSVDSMFKKIIQNEKEIFFLNTCRDYLLPKLISGDVRIPDAEKFVEAA